MPEKYYLDTSIWIDYYENRKDKYRPLGDWAHRLLSLIEESNQTVLISELVMIELEKHLTPKKTQELLSIYREVIKEVNISKRQTEEARKISREKNLSYQDILHAIIPRDNQATLVTRDHHFEKLRDIVTIMKPEELI
jgi:predicted nucleic acid-binding protein